MITEHQLDRAQAIENYGRTCFVCALGPLERRGLFILPLDPTGLDVPVCKVCHNHIKDGATVKALVQQLRRRANAMILVTRARATDGGYRVAPVPED